MTQTQPQKLCPNCNDPLPTNGRYVVDGTEYCCDCAQILILSAGLPSPPPPPVRRCINLPSVSIISKRSGERPHTIQRVLRALDRLCSEAQEDFELRWPQKSKH